MDTHHHHIDRARTGSTDRPITSTRWMSALLPGAVGATVLGPGSGMPTGAVLRWARPADPLATFALWLAVALLCLAVPVALSHLVAIQAAGRRVRTKGRWRSLAGFPGRPPGRPAERAPAKTRAASGCPVPHGQLPESRPSPSRAAGAVDVDPTEAEEFLRMFHAENPAAGPLAPRIDAVLSEISATGTYRHTPEELAFGARVAWRNNARCIGRLYWRSLQVRDLRSVSSATGVARRCFEHLGAAYNGGKLRPMISVFAPDTPTRRGPRIWNEQLIRYAGYEQPDGTVLGDPRYRDFTREMILRGWQPPEQRGAFDVLPLVVETVEDGPRMFALPQDKVEEVQLEHPELDWFAGLGLRWHSVPVISNSQLVIGGVSYPAAPFNGWYMGTEIGARNLADSDRYDLVPVVAERMGLDTSDEATLWRDRALVEINRAVLHSFRTSGVSITDHHTESDRFLKHLEREEQAGRRCPADWSWIVPPLSGSQTPVFHRYYDTEDQRPSFVTDDAAARRALQAGPPAFG